MVRGMLLEKRINSRFFLLCDYGTEKTLVKHKLDCHMHFGAGDEINGLPVLSFASSYSFAGDYKASVVCAIQVPSGAHLSYLLPFLILMFINLNNLISIKKKEKKSSRNVELFSAQSENVRFFSVAHAAKKKLIGNFCQSGEKSKWSQKRWFCFKINDASEN